MGAEMTRRFTARRCRRLLGRVDGTNIGRAGASLARYARAAVGHNRWRAWAPPKRALGHGSLVRATSIHLLPSLSLS
jgi:hypothetical protein